MRIPVFHLLQTQLAPIRFVLIGVLLGSLGGCSGKGSPHPVDVDLARQTLHQVLESWQAGETIESCQEHSPPVVVQDMDWITGRSLEAFEILDNGEPVDANLHAKVRLTLASSKSDQPSEKTVTYLVSTSPHLTVFRQMMQ
ncbi:MAG: hypothetical protein HUJ26_17400 [Planctomycetaceae bacterium]|nr:hypothetical protein [Planctomycetaceae bacterium]